MNTSNSSWISVRCFTWRGRGAEGGGDKEGECEGEGSVRVPGESDVQGEGAG